MRKQRAAACEACTQALQKRAGMDIDVLQRMTKRAEPLARRSATQALAQAPADQHPRRAAGTGPLMAVRVRPLSASFSRRGQKLRRARQDELTYDAVGADERGRHSADAIKMRGEPEQRQHRPADEAREARRRERRDWGAGAHRRSIAARRGCGTSFARVYTSVTSPSSSRQPIVAFDPCRPIDAHAAEFDQAHHMREHRMAGGRM